MPRSIRKLLLDVTLSCEEIIEFTSGKTFEEFKEDRMLQLAIEREFEIIGEALFRLEKVDQQNLGKKIPEYGKIVGFRNVIIHGYDIIDIAALWDFIRNHVPELLEKARNY